MRVVGGKIILSEALKMYSYDDRSPETFAPQCIQLLELFEIALTVDKGTK